LPTIAETVPDLIASGWQAVLAPNGTSEPIIAKASEALRAALEMADVREPLADRGAFVRPMSPDEMIRDQQVLWKPAIEPTGPAFGPADNRAPRGSRALLTLRCRPSFFKLGNGR
jgi:tripartite-type tricarboxylate transporter receptor subunit TctC